MNDEIKKDLELLIDVASNDTGQSRRVANLLLSWWNADECGGFDPTDLWCLDSNIRDSALRLIIYVAKVQRHPDKLGYARQFERLVRTWRPHLITE
ncbi:DUF7673 family protein [Lysobacter gummosus]|uniref:DUF7673 domain-containing protein n=1 Tax=Lysobacter gummosus TaxID=262324 RepID=A0ABY3XGG1_9GAMM|nr:hypothetical protein [Lysobacter gummosus]UNP30727.1 hypothetical protein MOV92_05575 [Lysobacter gummosus]